MFLGNKLCRATTYLKCGGTSLARAVKHERRGWLLYIEQLPKQEVNLLKKTEEEIHRYEEYKKKDVQVCVCV